MISLYEITEDEYKNKRDMPMIDEKNYRTNYYINKYLKKNARETHICPDRSEADIISRNNYNKYQYVTDIYDHTVNFRIKNPDGFPKKTINITFTFPYNEVNKMNEYLQEPWLDKNYKIYLVNPRLFQYYQEGSIGLAHVEDHDKKYGEGITERILSRINDMMLSTTGEALFYKII